MKRSIGAAVAVTSVWLGWRGLRTPPPRPTPTPLSRGRAEEEELAAPHLVSLASQRTVEPVRSIDGSEIAPLADQTRLSLAGPALEQRLKRLDVFREGLMRDGAPPPAWFEDEFRSLEARYFTSAPSMEE